MPGFCSNYEQLDSLYIFGYDPLLNNIEGEFVIKPYNPGLLTGDSRLSANRADCTVIATNHSSYNLEQIAASSKLVFDTRGATAGLDNDNIIRLGE